MTYLDIGALVSTSANNVDVPSVHDCNLAWLLAAKTTLPNCANFHEPVLAYPPVLDTSSIDKSVESNLNSLVVPPANICTSSPNLPTDTEFRFSLADAENSSELGNGEYPIDTGYTFFASRIAPDIAGWSGNHSSNFTLVAIS